MTVTLEEKSPPVSFAARRSSGERSRFCNLRGVRWRIDLGVLPSSQTISIENHRRVAADSRRSYASLRRRLLIDPHTVKDENIAPNLAMDNPLSQNPESMWGRFFHHAEIEKMVDQDLSRLYPEDGSYFQTSTCQGMLRRILLLWCLKHPDCGYGQGMHELLAPLIYVLHADLDFLSKLRGIYVDYFTDEFDGVSYPDIGGLLLNYRTKKAKSLDFGGSGGSCQSNGSKFTCLDDLDEDTREVYLLSDAYGAEGELGVVISERFMEHDAYCMFDALMSGAGGVVAMSDFFSVSPAIRSNTIIPPVIEASSALYYLLSTVDSSLHSHLVELGVEPQYFALRWLRVLFEREFSLNDLLVIWDELFSSPNGSCIENKEYFFKVLCSRRGAFISSMAVSMLLHVRSSLLATENATSCLQRLLSFPRNINVLKLIEKARYCQELALVANISSSLSSSSSLQSNSTKIRSSAVSTASSAPFRILPDTYWEEKWRVLHEEETLQKSDSSKGRKIKDLLGKKLGLSRTESDPSPAKILTGKKHLEYSVRRRLLDDLSQNFESNGDAIHQILHGRVSPPLTEDMRNCSIEEIIDDRDFTRTSAEPHDQIIVSISQDVAEETCLSTESSSTSSMSTVPIGEDIDGDIESEGSSLPSNSVMEEDDESTLVEDEHKCHLDKAIPDQVEDNPATIKFGPVVDEIKERKPLSNKFHWFWKFGKGNSTEGSTESGTIAKTQRPSSSTFGNGYVCRETLGCSASDNDTARIDIGDKKMMVTLKNLGQSMLENIQAIESVFQQDRGQAGNVLGGKGQATAIAALKELRKVSNLLSEM